MMMMTTTTNTAAENAYDTLGDSRDFHSHTLPKVGEMVFVTTSAFRTVGVYLGNGTWVHDSDRQPLPTVLSWEPFLS